MLEALASLVGPRAVGRVAQVERPLFVSGFALTTLFIGERKIEMDVRMGGHGAGGAAEVVNGFFELAEFFESAAQVVTRDAVERINLHGGEKAIARVAELAQLVVGDAEIDVRFDPIRREVHHPLIILDRLRETFGTSFAIERGLKKSSGVGPTMACNFVG